MAVTLPVMRVKDNGYKEEPSKRIGRLLEPGTRKGDRRRKTSLNKALWTCSVVTPPMNVGGNL